jgi:hypothetical protein
MAKRTILFIAVAAFLSFTVASWADDYWTYCHQYFPTSKDGVGGVGFVNLYDANYGFDNLVATSPGDDTFGIAYAITNKLGVNIRPDGFSFSEHITMWLAQPRKTLEYSVAELYDENGVTTTKFGSNDDIRMLDNSGYEQMIKHVEPLVFAQYPAPLNTLGVYLPDHTLGFPDLIVDNNGNIQGRSQRGNELALADFTVQEGVPDGDARIYFSAGRYATYIFGGGYYGQRAGVAWKSIVAPLYAGSDYNGNAHAADILTAAGLVNDPSYGIFEYAWKIAGTMLGDKFWLPANGSLVWNNLNGYVAASTAAGAPEAAGHLAMKNFMRFIFDIVACKVEDVNGNGKFDADYDKVLFSIANDKFYTAMTQWKGNEGWYSNYAVLTGQFGFDSDAIYLYQDSSVTTYMDRGTNLFFGVYQTTGNATIWGEKYGEYDITGFDIATIIPEPSTMILIIGTSLALGAGILRRRIR